MDDQEMQFADPAWQPSQQSAGNHPQLQEQHALPPPMNDPLYPQQQEQFVPPSQYEKVDTGGTSYETGYRGFNGYTNNSQQIGTSRPQLRKKRGPWAWIIVGIIILLLINGFAQANHSPPLSPPFYSNFDNRAPSIGDQISQSYNIGVHPTITIADPLGNINVQVDPNAHEVTIQANRQINGSQHDLNSNNLNDLQVNTVPSNNGDTLTVNVVDNTQPDLSSRSVDFVVTVPSSADLNLTTTSNDITVNGISGHMTLATDSGNINLSQATLTGESSLNTNSGSIEARQTTLGGHSIFKSDSGDVTFDGSLNSQGLYHFESNSGTVDVTLPNNSSFHTHATTNSGSIDSDFPEVKISSPDNNSTVATGDVGNAPSATLDIKTDSGTISIHQAQ